MKQEQYNQTKALQKYLTQEKWWNNPKLKDLWVTTHLGTKALVISVLQHYYILLDKHYNQLKVHSMRVKESYDVVLKRRDMLNKFIAEISPKVKKKKKVHKASGTPTNYVGSNGTTVPQRETEEYYIQMPSYSRWNSSRIVFGDIEDDPDE